MWFSGCQLFLLTDMLVWVSVCQLIIPHTTHISSLFFCRHWVPPSVSSHIPLLLLSTPTHGCPAEEVGALFVIVYSAVVWHLHCLLANKVAINVRSCTWLMSNCLGGLWCIHPSPSLPLPSTLRICLLRPLTAVKRNPKKFKQASLYIVPNPSNCRYQMKPPEGLSTNEEEAFEGEVAIPTRLRSAGSRHRAHHAS